LFQPQHPSAVICIHDIHTQRLQKPEEKEKSPFFVMLDSLIAKENLTIYLT